MDVELGADAADVFVQVRLDHYPGLLPSASQTHPCFATTPGADIIAQALTNNTSLITLKVKTKHGGRAEIDEASDKTVRVLRGAAAAAVRPRCPDSPRGPTLNLSLTHTHAHTHAIST